jgi:TonB family protein
MEKLILEFVLRSGLVAGGTWLVLRLLRVRAARVRHAIWASVVVVMLALPAWTVWGPKAVLRVLKPEPVVAATTISDVTQTWREDATTITAAPKTPWTVADFLAMLYLAGFALLLIRLLTGTVRARLLMQRAANVEGRLTSESCVAPVTIGWLRPSVILPPEWKSWTDSQLSAVLAHEDEHVRRRDPLVQWLALLNRAVFWFHPLAWWLERRLSSLAEEACDDAVLLRGHDPLDYSECLLGMAQAVRESGMRVSAVGMAMPGVSLPQRIRRIAAGVNVERVSGTRVAWTAAICAAMAIVFTTAAVGYAVEVPGVTSRTLTTIVPEVNPASTVITAPLAAELLRGSRMLLAQAGTPIPPAQLKTLQAPPPPAPPPTPAGPVFAVDGVTDIDSGKAQPTKPQSLHGIVQDPTGAVVARVPVTLANADTKAVVSTTTTDQLGRYVFADFDPGTYSVTIRAPGFKSETQTGIQVAANSDRNAGIMLLQLGTIAESITVTGLRSAPASPTVLGPMTTLTPSQPMPVGSTLSNAPINQAMDQLETLASNYQAQYQQNAQNSGAKPQRVGGMVTAASVIAQVKPVYPAALQSAGVQGTVQVNAIVGKDGTLLNLRAVNSPDPGLTQTSLEALKAWRYKPTTLNGEPVETAVMIDVNFMLQN